MQSAQGTASRHHSRVLTHQSPGLISNDGDAHAHESEAQQAPLSGAGVESATPLTNAGLTAD
jgi:hypothetical protein